MILEAVLTNRSCLLSFLSKSTFLCLSYLLTVLNEIIDLLITKLIRLVIWNLWNCFEIFSRRQLFDWKDKSLWDPWHNFLKRKKIIGHIIYNESILMSFRTLHHPCIIFCSQRRFYSYLICQQKTFHELLGYKIVAEQLLFCLK